MGKLIRALLIIIAIGAVVWLISHGVEAMRPVPSKPEKLSWGSDLKIEEADLVGIKARYVKVGSGPNLVLFHTLRTQLDIFQKMIPELQKHFTVYAVDYPGHGWSDIPNARYHPNDFYGWAEEFLKATNIDNATLAGISIGGTIVLELAARQNPRVTKVVAINPYDYQQTYSTGLKGSSLPAQIMFTATDIPFIGETFVRLRNPIVERMLFEGGVADTKSLDDGLFNEFSSVGNRPGHYRAFIALLREQHHWQEARKNYPNIKVPVLLIFGDQDWASEDDRKKTRDLIPGVKMETVKDGGHFLSLDKPNVLAQLIIAFANPGNAPTQ